MKKNISQSEVNLESELKKLDLTYKKNELLIFSSPYLAEQAFNFLRSKYKSKNLFLFPYNETLPYDFFSPTPEVRSKRIKTLSELSSQKKTTLVVSIQALMSPCADNKHIVDIANIEIGKEFNRRKFVHTLIDNGYLQKEVVRNRGEFSLRGSVVDFFSSNLSYPARIELLGNNVESIRLFNPETQLTTKKVKSLSTLPVFEYPLNRESISSFIKNWRENFDSHEDDSDIFKKITNHKPAIGAEIYLPLFYSKKVVLINFLKHFRNIYIDQDVTSSTKDFLNLVNNRYEEYRYDIQRPILPPNKLFASQEEYDIFLKSKKIKLFRSFKKVTKKELNVVDNKKHNEIKTNKKQQSLISLPEKNQKIVHLSYGIGLFKGLKQIETKGIINDCIEIEYLNKGKVFVPIESMSLVSRYFGPKETSLDSLGSKVWNKRKNVAIKKSFDIAAELLQVQAHRNSSMGSSYVIPKEYNNFISNFPYQETPDQITSMKEVETDLLNKKPMDRLVCGEVGFGKTELAMRAAFLASYNNKQTCVLVPTTLLAQQHLDSFKKRFEDTAVNIAMLTKNIKNKTRKILLEDLSKGKIDILIGTHALLQDSISYSDIGLLIIDEEHRFGVRQKEKIKKIKKDINVLSLSATPIPRSLNFALSKLKDFSIISSPPPDRVSVKTFVYSLNKNLISESIQREILRGGQIYYLCNDLRLINNRKVDLQDSFPELSIGIVHGRLKPLDIETTMLEFHEGNIDILVCSTIIESGLDIQNANTIIIESADKLGLAQLHQLRGRVGRSNKQAYAYFLKSSSNIKRKKARSRIEAFEDSDSLSAGLLLAIKDLEIRGAGEILGEKQSGILQSIGLDLYTRLLNKAADYIKKGILEFDLLEKEKDINLGVSSYIPKDYLPDLNQRLIMYNRIALARSNQELRAIQIEMIDRFGLFPKEINNLFIQNEIRLIAESLSISSIQASRDRIKIMYINKEQITMKTPSKLEDFPSRIKEELLNI